MTENQGGKNRMQDERYQRGDKRKIDTLADAVGPATKNREDQTRK